MEIKDQGIIHTSKGNNGERRVEPSASENKTETTAPSHENEQELVEARVRLKEEVAGTEDLQTPIRELTSRTIKYKRSLITKLFDRLNFPSIHDKRKALRIGYAVIEVAVLSLIASKIVIDTAVNGMVLPELVWFASDSLRKITTLSFLPIVASLSTSFYISAKEHFNKTQYGKTLTVTKVAASSAKEIDGLSVPNERFLGEMHFVGKGSIKNPLSCFVPAFFFKSESENLKQGLVDLSALAEACSNNSSKLEGINVFFGISPIVTRNLERFGFQIFPYKDRRNLLERVVDIPLDMINLANSIPMRLRFKAHAIQPSQTAVVTRDSLIENKDKIKKLIDRLNRSQTQTLA